MFIQHHNDTIPKTDAWRITHEGRRMKKRQEKYSPLSLFVMFAFERMLEIEHKLHILAPLLWPSRCVFIVLLMLGSTPSGLSEGPLGRVWPSLPHLVSTVWKSVGNCIGGFPSAPSVGCGLPYHIWSLLSGIRLATALGPKLNWVK